MRFLVDECTGPAVARWLKVEGYDVYSVYDQARGIDDEEVIQKAFEQDRILITNDKDFGAKIFRERKPHRRKLVKQVPGLPLKCKIDGVESLKH